MAITTNGVRDRNKVGCILTLNILGMRVHDIGRVRCTCTECPSMLGHMSRFWVDKDRTHRKNLCFVIATLYGPGLKM